MACHLGPDACRAAHIAGVLDDAEQDGADYEARCPVCGHRGFRISHARVRAYRNVWVCNCQRCKCPVGLLRAKMLGRDVSPGCLGTYDGPVQRAVDPEAARRMDLAIRDILAVPHLKPADMRIVLAEAQGQKVPEEFRPFVKWAVSIGIRPTQAKEAAARWCRPPDSRPPQTGGRGVDHQS